MERMTVLTLKGQVPAKKNSKNLVPVRGRMIIVSNPAYKKWEKRVIEEIVELLPEHPVLEHAEVRMDFTNVDRRRRDLSNMEESVMDALVKAKILKDDNVFVVGEKSAGFLGVDKENAGVMITIRYEA